MDSNTTDPGLDRYQERELVLLVDANVLRRRELASRLEAKGISVVMATDGQVALDILEASPAHGLPQVIASEVALPRIDGARLTAILKQMPAYTEIPVILYSGSPSEPPGRPGTAPRAGIALASVEGVIESRLRIQRSLRRLSEARASFARTT